MITGRFQCYQLTIARAAKIFLALHLFTEYVGAYKVTTGPSMLATLEAHGDGVIVSKFNRRGRGIEVGDIISFKNPLKWQEGAMKRVVGMPGDFVLRDSPTKGDGTMIQIPDGHCWVAGDNLPHSRDSRTYGPLPLALVKGKVVARVYPWKERKWLTNTLKSPRNDTNT